METPMKKNHFKYRDPMDREVHLWNKAKSEGFDSVLKFVQSRLNTDEKYDWFRLDLALASVKVREQNRHKLELDLLLVVLAFVRRVQPLLKDYSSIVEVNGKF